MAISKSPQQSDLFDNPVKAVQPESNKTAQNVNRCLNCGERYLSDRKVAECFDISRATVWRWLAQNPLFPKPVKLSRGMSRWKLSDLIEFEMLAANETRTKSAPEGAA